MDYNSLKEAVHSVSVLSNLGVLGVILKQHKVWTRAKDRLNSIWYQYCQDHDIPYEHLEK